MAKGVCKGCKKYKDLNKAGYCNVSNTFKGACNAEAWGMVAGERLMDALEKIATKYISKSQFNILVSIFFLMLIILYFNSRK